MDDAKRKTNANKNIRYSLIHFREIISRLIIKEKYLCLQEIVSNAYLIIYINKENVCQQDFINYKKKTF